MDLLVIAPGLVPGGLATHVRCLVEGARARNADLRLVSGPVDAAVSLGGADHLRIDLASHRAVSAVHQQISDARRTLLIHSPETYHLGGLLVDAPAAAIGVHGSPGTTANWLGSYRHTFAAGAIKSLPGLPIVVPGEQYVSGIAAEFSLATHRVHALPNAIVDFLDPVSAAASGSILVPVRLSDDKNWVLDAAIELAAASSKPLHVVGAGPHAQAWRDRLEHRCRTPWSLTESLDLDRHIASADVVVGAGLVAMEAAAAGRRVAVPGKAGGWKGVVSTATLADMRSANFVTWGSPEYADARTIWEQATALSVTELDELAAVLREECAPELMYRRLCGLVRPAGTPDPVPLSVATFETINESERDQQKVHRDYAVVLAAKEFYEQQAANWERAFREVSPDTSETDAREVVGQEDASHGAPSAGSPLRSLMHRAYDSRSLPLHSTAAFGYFAKKDAPARVRAGVRRRTGMTVRRSQSIPTIAWLAEYAEGAWDVVIGSGVESSARGIYEGAWDGDFASGPPAGSEFAFGTGIRHDPSGPLFLCSGNPAQLCYVLRRRRDGRIYVSNSLVFTLTAAGAPMDGPFLTALSTLLKPTILAYTSVGVDKAPTRLHSDDEFCLDAVCFFDFQVGDQGDITRRWRRPRRYFSDYRSYRDFLHSTLGRLLANAQSSARQRPMHPFGLISRGYDSVTAAVMGREAGLTDVGTLAGTVEGRDDSGEHVAKKLGLRCYIHEPVIGRHVTGLDSNAIGPLRDRALEFLTEGGVGLDLTLLPFESHLDCAVLLTGNYGDIYYERGTQPKSGFARHALGGPPSAEFRLRLGFVTVPVPILGMRFTPPIVDLNRSVEMEPFSVGGDYDRPVPRRLGEQAGLDRGDFGTAKTATSPQFLNAHDLYLDSIATISERYVDWQS